MHAFSLCAVIALVVLASATPSKHFKDLPHENKPSYQVPRGKPIVPTPGKYNTTSGVVPNKLNVHMVPHTHDDVGWLKTVDEYYMGLNNSIQDAGVQYILDSVMVSLAQNPDRKFIYVEIGFFERWWNQQSFEMQEQVRQFVQNGQLEFINGGWCMSDEAAPYYVDMVDQQTIGHQFLLNNFGPAAIPKTGWQIDPFGHSSTMGILFAMMGMNSWFFGRIDYEDREWRESNLTAEVIMTPSASLGDAVNIFTGVMRGYGPLNNFFYDQGSSDAPVQDDPTLEDYNVQYIVDLFVEECLEQAEVYRTNNIMLSMGSDFNYQNANTWFKNLDKILNYVNQDGRINVLYSTPTIYTNAKYAAGIEWPVKTDDWFPYADSPHSVWSGYFTSRPALKGYVRSTSNYLQACRQLETQQPSATPSTNSYLLWASMGIAQHHDAVSGTSKQHVAYDYALRLSQGIAVCKDVMDESLSNLITGTPSLQFTDCPLLNQSICDATTSGANTAIVLYNSIGQNRSEYIRLPVLAGKPVTITDYNGLAVAVDVFPDHQNPLFQSIVFVANIPAMGFSTYFLEYTATASEHTRTAVVQEPTGPTQSISNEFYTLTFNSATGRLSSITNTASGITTNLDQNFGWFNGSMGNTDQNNAPGQASGAYIFRPNCTENVATPCAPYLVTSEPVSLTITVGQNVQEAYQVFSDWTVQTIRLNTGDDAIDVSYTIGPIPIGDGLGKEIVTVWSTDLDVNQTWYTDSNGREMMQRIFNYRKYWNLTVTDPVSDNFYPVDSSIFERENGTSGRQLTIITDRAQGGASLINGELQLMVHRRLLYDDSRGVGEPLNETGTTGLGLVITSRQRVIFETASNSPLLHKWHTRRLTFPPLLSFTPLTSTPAQYIGANKVEYSGLVEQLPVQLHLLTVQENLPYGNAGNMILRIDHSFEAGEDPVYSQPVTLQLDQLFVHLSVDACTEMSLTANQPLANINRFNWATNSSEPVMQSGFARSAAQIKADTNALTVTINPMEIRTWSCDFHRV